MEHPIVISSSKYISNSYNNQINMSAIISRYISSASGQAKLAATMAMPLRNRLDYQSIARKCLTVEPMPSGASEFYSKNINHYLHDDVIIDSSGNVGRKGSFSSRKVKFPPFTIFQSPIIKVGDISQHAYPMIDRATQKLREELMSQEDSEIFRALDDIIKEEN